MCFGSVTEASDFFAWGNHLSCVPKQRAAEVLSFLNALLGVFISGSSRILVSADCWPLDELSSVASNLAASPWESEADLGTNGWYENQ
jgi:hypothetical protein